MGDIGGVLNGNKFTLNDSTGVTSLYGLATTTSTYSGLATTTTGRWVNDFTVGGTFTGTTTTTYNIRIDDSRINFGLSGTTGTFHVGDVVTLSACGVTGSYGTVYGISSSLFVKDVVWFGNLSGPWADCTISNTSGASATTASEGIQDMTYSWNDGTTATSGVAITTSTTTLSNGVTVRWSIPYNHSLGDTFTFSYTPNKGRIFAFDSVNQSYKIGDVDRYYGNALFTVSSSAFRMDGTPTTATSSGLFSLGKGFSGLTATSFLGSASGTILAINTATSFTGNLADLQIGGVSKFNIDALGNISSANLTQGSVPFVGASGLISQDNSHFSWDAVDLTLGIGTSATSTSALTVRSSNATARLSSGDGTQLFIDPTSPYTGTTTTTGTITIRGISFTLGGMTAVSGHYYSDSYPSIGHCTTSLSAGGSSFQMQLAGTSTTGWQYVAGGSLYDYGTTSDCSGTPVASSTISSSAVFSETYRPGGTWSSGTYSVATSTYGYVLIGDAVGSRGIKIKFANTSGYSFGQVWNITLYPAGYMSDIANFQNATGTSIFDINSVGIIKSFDTTGLNKTLNLDPTNNTYSIGDIDAITSGAYLNISAGSAGATSGIVSIYNADLTVHGTSGGTCTINGGTGGVACTSDARLKQNVMDLPDALSQINQLRPVTFNWKDPKYSDATHIGFIAQDMQKVYPQLVTVVDPENGYIGIDYAGLVTPIVKAIQEMDLKLEPLTSLDPAQDNSLASLIKRYLADTLNGLEEIFVKKVQTNELCLQDTCVTQSQLQQLLNQANVQSAIIGPVITLPTASTTNTGGSNGGSTSTSTDSTASSTDGGAVSSASSTDAGATASSTTSTPPSLDINTNMNPPAVTPTPDSSAPAADSSTTTTP